jgi:uncharacterized protein YccT (UPF0319 family)
MEGVFIMDNLENIELTQEEKASIARSAYMRVRDEKKYANDEARLARNEKKRIWNAQNREKVKEQQIKYWAKKFEEAERAKNNE